MRSDPNTLSKRSATMSGFTTVELVVTMAIVVIVSAVALPRFVETYQNYQLNDYATKMANILKFTRFEAIRRNTVLSCMTQLVGAAGLTQVWADSDANGAFDNTERQVLFSGPVILTAAANVPGTGALAAAIGPGTVLVNPAAAAAAPSIMATFDARGAVNPPAVFAYYLSYANNPNTGYRAVILLPSGSMEVWASDPNGNWRTLD